MNNMRKTWKGLDELETEKRAWHELVESVLH